MVSAWRKLTVALLSNMDTLSQQKTTLREFAMRKDTCYEDSKTAKNWHCSTLWDNQAYFHVIWMALIWPCSYGWHRSLTCQVAGLLAFKTCVADGYGSLTGVGQISSDV